MTTRLLGLLLASVLWLLATSCAIRFARPPGASVTLLRVSEAAGEGDPARRASLRIVVNGLDADAADQPERALGIYEEAIRVDPNNPYAYLAVARHHAETDDPDWALSFLDKADALFRAEGGPSPRVEPYLVGLRGQALYASGHFDEGLVLLEQAREAAPDVWSDGVLSAAELR